MVAERGLLIAKSLSTRQMGELYQDISTHNMDPHLYSEDIGSADYSYFLPILILYKLVNHKSDVYITPISGPDSTAINYDMDTVV